MDRQRRLSEITKLVRSDIFLNRTDAEWLLSQLSASEERVRALEGVIQNVIDASVNDADCCTVCGCDATFHCSDCAIELAESLLPSPPQVGETK